MKTGKIVINKKEYLLCFSLRVMKQCGEKFGSIDGISEALSKKDIMENLDNALWLISVFMQAGAKYAEIEGIYNPTPFSLDELYDLCDIDSFKDLKFSIMDTISNGMERDVETEEKKGKNAQTTQPLS